MLKNVWILHVRYMYQFNKCLVKEFICVIRPSGSIAERMVHHRFRLVLRGPRLAYGWETLQLMKKWKFITSICRVMSVVNLATLYSYQKTVNFDLNTCLEKIASLQVLCLENIYIKSFTHIYIDYNRLKLIPASHVNMLYIFFLQYFV